MKHIREAFEKALANELEAYFGSPDLTLNLDGDYQDHEVYGAFLAFESCWNQRPALGMFIDVTIGELKQHDDGSSPRMNFGTAMYHLPPGDYTLHAVQRVEGLEDIAAAEQAKVEQTIAPGWNAPDVDPVVKPGNDKYFIIAARCQRDGKVYTLPATYCNDLPLMSEDPDDAKGNGWSQRLAGENDEDCDILITGWYDVRSHSEYDNMYSAALRSGDELVAWREIEAYPS